MLNGIRLFVAALASVGLLICAGCGGGTAGKNGKPQPIEFKLKAIDPAGNAGSDTAEQPLNLFAAQNEWTSFCVQAGGFARPSAKPARIRITDLSSAAASIESSNVTAFQLLSMPLDLNRAGFVRHSGLAVSNRAALPRALLPMPMQGGAVDLSTARDPSQPANPSSRATGTDPVAIWFDLHVPSQTPSGH